MNPSAPLRDPFAFVSDMNVAFSNPKGHPTDFLPLMIPNDNDGSPRYNLTKWQQFERQCKGIEGELVELREAIAEHNLDKARDALCDICVFAMGGHHLLGVDFNRDMNAVLEGVMTRFCKDADDLVATVLKWAALGITDVYTEGGFPQLCVKARTTQTSTKGEVIAAGKFLKSASYKEPTLYDVRPVPPSLPPAWDAPAQARRTAEAVRLNGGMAPSTGPVDTPPRAFLGSGSNT